MSSLRSARWFAVLAAAVVVGMPARTMAGATIAKPRAYAWGDSLLDEAKAYIPMTGLAGAIHATIGQAPCDYLKAMTASVSLKNADVVAVETAGNSDTTCMLEPGSTSVFLPIGSSDWEAKYRHDLDAIFALTNRLAVPTVLLEPPPMDPAQPAAAIRDDLIRTVFPEVESDIAARYPLVTVLPDARDAVGGDTFVHAMPCLFDETAAMGCDAATDTIVVRSPDGLHFCPAGLGSNRTPCSLPYDPGARRFGDAIERIIRARV